MISTLAERIHQARPEVCERLSAVSSGLDSRRAAAMERLAPTYDELAERGEQVTRAALEGLQALQQRAGNVLDLVTFDFTGMSLDLEEDSLG